MKSKTKWLRIILPLLIVLVGVAGLRIMIASRKAPQKAPKENPGALVEVIRAERSDRTVTVEVTGTVQPLREIAVTPQVSGKVNWVARGMVAGGFFREGELLFTIEPVDYELAVQRSGAALAKAEVDLATVEGQALVARQEWERLDLAGGEPPPPLVLYEPQMKNARATVASARATLEQARLDLARTEIRAPFNCRVRSEEVEIGQYVKSGSVVATLAGTDRAEVIVPLSREELDWIEIPRAGEKSEGSAATIRFEGTEPRWEGFVERSFGEADEKSRLTRVAVEIDDPYALLPAAKGRPPLEVGNFVNVSISGRIAPSVIVIPRVALRTGDVVWSVDENDLLKILKVDVLRRERDEILLSGGVEAGARIVLTPLSGAADGMRLRPRSAGGER